MAMDKNSMADALISEMKGIDKPAQAMLKFSSAIKNYIQDNCEVTFSWIAMLPPPASTPDPATSFKGEVKFPVFMLSVPPVPDANAAMAALSLSLTSQINGGLILPAISAPPFAIPPAMFLPTPILLTASGADNQRDCMLHLADEIVTQLKLKINPIPLPGAHPPYVIPAPGAIMTAIS